MAATRSIILFSLCWPPHEWKSGAPLFRCEHVWTRSRHAPDCLRASSQEIPQPSITEIVWKIKYLKCHANFPGANELRKYSQIHCHWSTILDNKRVIWSVISKDQSLMICLYTCVRVNSLWPSDAIWRQRSGSTLAQVMACWLTAPSHYLNQCWLIISEVQWHSY